MRSFIRSALLPSTSTVPESGEMIDMIMRMVVLLPAPLGPRNPHSERSGICSEISRTACTLPNRLFTPSMRTAVRVEKEGLDGLGAEFFCATDIWASVATREPMNAAFTARD